MMTESVHTILDARGVSCPLPILRTHKELAALENGELLAMTATDPGSLKDIDSFCRQTGHRLIESRTEDDEFHFLICRS